MLKEKAKEVMSIIEAGGFQSIEGDWVNIKDNIRFSSENSRLYYPSDFNDHEAEVKCIGTSAVVEVTSETTQIAVKRLFDEGLKDIVLLNFASAKNPGGGFINGAKAQEEDLARCSTLYQCLQMQPEYYQANRSQDSMLYTDHIIYSPDVPWFRTRSRDDPNELYFASVITAPAPNASQAVRHGETTASVNAKVLHRSRCILEVALNNNHKNLVLGAWGCGVFGNDPDVIAAAFKYWLESQLYCDKFNKIVFAVYDRSKAVS